MKRVIENLEIDLLNQNEKYFIHVFCIGKTTINFDDEWDICDRNNVDSLFGSDGVFYTSKTESIKEMMKELSASREDVLESLTYFLNNDLKSQTYQIYFDKINKNGSYNFNQKYDKTFDWNGDNGDSLEKAVIDFFVG